MKAERVVTYILPATIAFLFVFGVCYKVYGQEPEKSEPAQFLIQTVVTKKDVLDRAQSVEVRASGGTCMAEVTYDSDKIPRVHVLVMLRNKVQHLGYLQINNRTYEDVTGEDLLWCFSKAIMDYCIPLIIPGAVGV